jgi:hypothetical protein
MTPFKNVSLEGHMTIDRNYNLRLTSKEDSVTSQVTDVFINPQARTVEVKYRYDKG